MGWFLYLYPDMTTLWKIIIGAGAAIIALWSFWEAIHGIYQAWSDYGPRLHVVAHHWWASSPWRSTLSMAAIGALIVGGIFYIYASRTPHDQKRQANLSVPVGLPPETEKTIKSKLNRLPRLSMFVDGKLKDSQTWEMIEQFRSLFHDTGHQAENVELTQDYPTPGRGEIDIYLMDSPSPDLIDALTLICDGLGRKATFSKTLHGNDIRILIGPPGSPQPERILAPVAAASMPQGKIAWNFGQFLGMISGAFDKNIRGPQFRVTTFQAFGRNVWSSRIDKLTGYVEIDKTKERFPLLYNKDGRAVDLIQMPAIGSDEKTDVLCYFTHNKEDYGSSRATIEIDRFLKEFTPFTFVFSINGGAETRLPFSTEDCRAQVQTFMDYVNRPKH